MSIINLPTIKKFHLAMRDGYTDVKYGDRLIVSVENPDLYNFRIKDTSFVYYPEPGNTSKRVGYYHRRFGLWNRNNYMLRSSLLE